MDSMEGAAESDLTDTRRRVKLYVLNEDRQWDDRGTGHVTSIYSERLQGTALLVRSETDGSLLLESKIELDTAYQKQQETLVVWSEGDKYDLALSFQEKAGCDEIWEKICQVQGKDPSVDITQEIVEDSGEEGIDVEDPSPGIELPPCELSRLEEISEIFSSALASPLNREKLSTAVEADSYIKGLLELYRMCEDLENNEGLHQLYDVFKSLFLLNKNSLLETLLAEDNIMDVVGALEHDPALPEPKKHRDFLLTTVKYHEVVPFSNPELKAKIHQTYRVMYIQDVILPAPSVLEENMLSSLSSFVFFNKVEIVNLIQEDTRFLQQVFEQLSDDETDDEKRRDLVLFLKEFCTFSQTLQPQNRETFFKTLSGLGILETLERILGMDDSSIKSAAVDIFSYIVEFSPSMVREFILQEARTQDEDDLLINLVIEQMISDPDPELGGAVQLMGIIRLLLDPENMIGVPANRGTEKTEFLSFFYKHSMHVLCAPLLANTAEGHPSKDDYVTAVQLSLLLEILTFCVEHHSFHARCYVINKDLLSRVLVLLKSGHAFLALGAVRFMRRMIGCREEFYNRYIIRCSLFSPLVQCFIRNGDKYNLLNSAIIEIFEFIKGEDIKSLIAYVVENHFSSFEKVDYVETFKSLKLRYDQQVDRERNRSGSTALGLTSASPGSGRVRRDPRTMEEDEELWFDEDEPETGPSPTTAKANDNGDFDLSRFLDQRRALKATSEDTVEPAPRVQPRPQISINIKSPNTSPNTSLTASPPTPPAGGPGNPGTPRPLTAPVTLSVSPATDVKDGGGDPGAAVTGGPDAEVKTAPSSTPEDTVGSADVVKKPGWRGLVAYDSDEESEESEEENGSAAPSSSSSPASAVAAADSTTTDPRPDASATHEDGPEPKRPRLDPQPT